MKSYTDIEQSKKLAEILPLESADMEYLLEQWIDEKTGKHKEEYYEIPVIKVEDDCPLQPITLDCWSLASLLNYMREIDFFPEIEADEHGVTMSINYYDEEEARLLAPVHNIEAKAESFIDACYELILKYHEQKIL